MKVVTLCGSMRFAKQMEEIALELEIKHDWCVICPIFSFAAPLNADEISKIANSHFQKIDIADIVYIVNIDGYIGESVSRELEYAKAHNKEIVYHET